MESALEADRSQRDAEIAGGEDRNRSRPGFLCGACYDAVFQSWTESLVMGSTSEAPDAALLCPACFQAVLREWLDRESIEQVALKFR